MIQYIGWSYLSLTWCRQKLPLISWKLLKVVEKQSIFTRTVLVAIAKGLDVRPVHQCRLVMHAAEQEHRRLKGVPLYLGPYAHNVLEVDRLRHTLAGKY